MGKKDAFSSKTPIDQYRKQIGKQDYKKTKSALKETRLKVEAKKQAPGIKDVIIVIAAVLAVVLVFYSLFLYLTNQ
ncbi:triple QxxK/R motif-containing protein [Protopterus annectens]|uniref:triple QxxK/R motif-containing protein n=1 Tax=Protopterus annectens TaxID=7888 RepID=UPI001CFB60BD|nr:triple QxxK/R motif-containing protein [Protopterus annectens]